MIVGEEDGGLLCIGSVSHLLLKARIAAREVVAVPLRQSCCSEIAADLSSGRFQFSCAVTGLVCYGERGGERTKSPPLQRVPHYCCKSNLNQEFGTWLSAGKPSVGTEISSCAVWCRHITSSLIYSVQTVMHRFDQLLSEAEALFFPHVDLRLKSNCKAKGARGGSVSSPGAC